ncbi:hypothetical protein AB6T38_12210 [Aliiglaciecola sp. SL4]|uniref:hypothetical protein n=1 Tax=Aliiglaciecola sp. SL4 TaxID=3239806 RepID=UPI00355BB21D
MKLSSSSLFATLDSDGFVYEVKYTKKGIPYAGFRWEFPQHSGMLRAFTIFYDEDTLRISLHEPMGVNVRLKIAECLKYQQDFPVSRLQTNSDDDNKLELCIAIPIENIKPDIKLLKSLMIHLTNNADELLGTFKVSSRQAPTLPAMPSELSLADILVKLGLQPIQHQGAFVIDLRLPGLDLKSRFSVYHLATGWIKVSGHLLEKEEFEIKRLPESLIQQLQLWAPIGRFVTQEFEGRQILGCEVAGIFMHHDPSFVIAQVIKAAMLLLGSASQQYVDNRN